MENNSLFEPISLGNLTLNNRIVMAPMTRAFSPGGVPGDNVAAYYRRRAEGGAGLIITEGTWIPHPGASNEENAPKFYGEDALSGWAKVVEQVHTAGGRIFPQLWHAGLVVTAKLEGIFEEDGSIGEHSIGPSGIATSLDMTAPKKLGREMTQKDIDDVIEAYAQAAETAEKLQFDGVAFHGAHGFLIDQFFWKKTNLRSDRYGGSIAHRTRFACEVIQEAKRRISPELPVMLRISQWKTGDFEASIADTPEELESFLAPLVDCGVDIFDCSQRRFWEPAFEGSDLELAGWVKKITGKPTMTVGSVGLDVDMRDTVNLGGTGKPASLDELIRRLERGDFDLVAVGRALLTDPQWPEKIRKEQHDQLLPFDPGVLATLV